MVKISFEFFPGASERSGVTEEETTACI